MFLLAELKDTIRIPPDTFHMKLIDAVKDEINRKLANKVIKYLYIIYLFKKKLIVAIPLNALRCF